MVRRAAELKSLNELNLSVRTRKYIEQKKYSLDELVKEARDAAHYATRQPKFRMWKWCAEMVIALDEAGYIRHDIDERTFLVNMLYYDIARKRSTPNPTKYAMCYASIKTNEQYEDFTIVTDEEVARIISTVEENLTGMENTLIKLRYGLEDGREWSCQEIRERLEIEMDDFEINNIAQRAARKLSGIGRF